MHALTLTVLAAIPPLVIQIKNLYSMHERMDTLAHASSGVCIGAATWTLTAHPWVTVLVTFALALAWEWVEPRLQPYVGRLHVGSQDTEADIAVVTLAGTIVALLFSTL